MSVFRNKDHWRLIDLQRALIREDKSSWLKRECVNLNGVSLFPNQYEWHTKVVRLDVPLPIEEGRPDGIVVFLPVDGGVKELRAEGEWTRGQTIELEDLGWLRGGP